MPREAEMNTNPKRVTIEWVESEYKDKTQLEGKK